MKQDVGMHFCIIPNRLILSGHKGAYLTLWPPHLQTVPCFVAGIQKGEGGGITFSSFFNADLQVVTFNLQWIQARTLPTQ